ncbi:MAG: ABC transporter substrate-binding protein [Candidatus Ranarchaeia archaeon]|jgi:ABC-type transport system substrate-binding protein
MKNRHLRLFVLGVVFVLMFSGVAAPAIVRPVAAQGALDDLHGPYVDSIIGDVIVGEDQEALALLADDIDMIGEQMDPAYLNQLLADPDIKLFQTDRLGYGLTVLPTTTFPWNYTLFRRAFAYTFDKEEGIQDIWGGFAAAQDSVIPSSQPSWSDEANLPDTYYAQDIQKAIDLLLAAGFVNDSTPDTFDGVTHQWWFEGPHGETLELDFWASVESGIAQAYGDLIADNLKDAHVKCQSVYISFNTWLPMFANHTLTEPVFLGNSLPTDPDWLFYEFHSSMTTQDWQNAASFSNATVDLLLEELLISNNLTRIQEIVDEVQLALWYESPWVLCYMNKILSFARDDDWQGHVNSAGEGAFRYWGRMKTAPIPLSAEDPDGDGFGGILRINLPTDIDSRNYLTTSSGYSDDILGMVYDSLIRQDPYSLDDVVGLAWNWSVSLLAATNQTVMTFELFPNATWHDGEAVTAADVNFTMYYLRDNAGHNWVSSYPDVHNVTIIDDYTVQVIANTSSYFVFHNVGFGIILPEHIWSAYPTTANFTTYDPTWPVGSGPFNFSAWVPGEFVQLDYYDQYYLRPPTRGAAAVVPGIDPILAIAAIAVVAVVVLVAGYFIGKRGK